MKCMVTKVKRYSKTQQQRLHRKVSIADLEYLNLT